MAMRGGKRKGAGRKPGSLNKVTADIKAIAQPYGKDAVAVLFKIMNDDLAPHAARVSAADKLLDRGYGKARQSIDLGAETSEACSLAFFYAKHGTKPSNPGDA